MRVSELNITAVVAESNRGWILDRIAHEVVKQAGKNSQVVYFPSELPDTDAYFVTHFSLVPSVTKLLKRREKTVGFWYTHPPSTLRGKLLLFQALHHSDIVISMSTVHISGPAFRLFKNRVRVEIPGVDLHRFKPHRRGIGKVGFCSAYYERKNPEMILNIIKTMKDEEFILVGSRWEKWEKWDELISRSNLNYVDLPYEMYPSVFEEIDIFVSTSKLEGGPIPLLEALASNSYPVVTDTGFARDIITDKSKGIVLSVDAPVEDYCEAIRLARQRKDENVADLVSGRSWSRFGLACAENLVSKHICKRGA
jgi:glycosyltransferase involved in cell wall biosynthesis